MIGSDFHFAGQYSTDLGIYLVRLRTGLTSSPFLAEKELIEESIMGRDKPYLLGVRRTPLTLSLTLACEEPWTFERRRELARWLSTDSYELLYSAKEPYKWYYAQYMGGVDLSHSTAMQGYIEVQMRCDSPYAYSPIFNTEYDLSSITVPATITFTNEGDVDVKPEIWIKKFGAGDVTIENLTYADIPTFEFMDLVDQETVFVSNEDEQIETDLTDMYRFENFNNNYLVLPRGVNNLQVTGACQITLRWQYKVLG